MAVAFRAHDAEVAVHNDRDDASAAEVVEAAVRHIWAVCADNNRAEAVEADHNDDACLDRDDACNHLDREHGLLSLSSCSFLEFLCLARPNSQRSTLPLRLARRTAKAPLPPLLSKIFS